MQSLRAIFAIEVDTMVTPILPLWIVSEKALDFRPDGIDWLVFMLVDGTTFWNG